jgi:hypothetical protein
MPVLQFNPHYSKAGKTANALPLMPPSSTDVSTNGSIHEGEYLMTEKSTTVLAAEYAELYGKRVAAEKVVASIKEELSRQEVVLLEKFAQDGVASIKVIGGTVFLHHQVWASATDPGLLAVSDWGWMVKDSVNSNTLSATVRELEIDGDGNPIFPEGVPAAAIKVTDKYSIRVR